MELHNRILITLGRGAPLALLLAVAPCGGYSQDASNEADQGVEITRDATELAGMLREQEADVVNTALVLTQQGGPATIARCVAFNANGEIVGRAWVKVPTNGVRVVLASDVTAGGDLVGSLRCHARGHLVGSAFVFGRGLTDAAVHNRLYDGESRIRAQAVVSR
jgi:hypothetical protein